jgi:hypothetical protein
MKRDALPFDIFKVYVEVLVDGGEILAGHRLAEAQIGL